MPTFAEYQLSLVDWTGEQVDDLWSSDFVSFLWEHRLNGPGACELDLVAETDTKDQFVVDYGVKLNRNHGDGWYTEFYGIHLDDDERLTSGDVDEHYWTSLGLGPDHFLDQPLLWPLRENVEPDPYAVGGSEVLSWHETWWMYAALDDVMKQMVSESMGPDADADRQFANIAIQGQVGAGVWDAFEDRYPRLLAALQGLSGERSLTDFRLEPVAGGFEFRTYSPYYGTDRRQGHHPSPTVFSLDNGNMLNPRRRTIRRQQTTVAIGGWEGGGAERTVEVLTDPAGLALSPYRRREVFVDLRDLVSEDSIAARLAQTLEDGAQVTQISFNPLQTAGCLYRRDWALGDLCSAELWGEEYDVRIVRVGGRLDGRDEEVIAGEIELWTREEVVT